MILKIPKPVETEDVVLESCPFCGSDSLRAEFVNGRMYSNDSAYVCCRSCGATIKEESEMIGYGDSPEKLLHRVIAKWNSRVSC